MQLKVKVTNLIQTMPQPTHWSTVSGQSTDSQLTVPQQSADTLATVSRPIHELLSIGSASASGVSGLC